MKKSVALATLASLLLVSCGTASTENSDKLAAIIVETSCIAQYAKTATATASGADFDMAAFQAKIETMSKELKEHMTASFKNESDMDKVYATLSDKAAFKKDVAEKAMSKCQAAQDTVDGIFDEIEKTPAK